MDNWIKHTEVDYDNALINQIHVDTRDFHCLTMNEEHDEKIDLENLKKFDNDYFYTPSEVKNIVQFLFDKSGGEGKWRMLCFKSLSCGWELKYIRFYKTQYGFVACNREGKFKDKMFWTSEIEEKYLGKHK